MDVKDIVALLDEKPSVSEELLDLFAWISRYYFAPPGEIIRLAFPPGLLSSESLNLALTPKGRSFLSGHLQIGDENLSPTEGRRILEKLSHLPQTGRTSLKAFAKQAGRISRSKLRGWQRLGLIDISSEPAGSGVGKRKIEVVSPAFELEAAMLTLQRAPSQMKVFRRLVDAGPSIRSAFTHGDPRQARALSELIKRGLVAVEHRSLARSPLDGHILPDNMAAKVQPALWPDQEKALREILPAVTERRSQSFLLHGTPGCGKTEVYLQAAGSALASGRSVLMLVPEISLTPQLVSRVSARFGDRVAVLHSGLSPGERHDEWQRIHSGEASVLVGARSAILAPMQDLGLIVVDEEQDSSYKSENHVHYQARDVAVMRARRLGIPVVLGSATPSVESIANAGSDNYTLIKMDRPDRPELPKVRLIDMSKIRRSRRSLLSVELVLGIKERLSRQEQVILFLNRRGWAPYLTCQACKTPLQCNHCSVTMSYHRTVGKLICHSCGIMRAFPERCPECEKEDLELIGVGTQRVEDEIELTFPKARLARLDRDAIRRKGAMAKILGRFANGEIDILIGTQLVTKGHDFPGVTLVGVLSSDHSLNIPDFRAGEHTFQQLIQVAGRAGRGELPGEMLVQTFHPDHFVYRCVSDHDTDTFYQQELDERSGLWPPYRRLALIRLEGPDSSMTFDRAARMADRLRRLASNKAFSGILVLGPSQAPIAKVRGKFRMRVLVKSGDRPRLHHFLKSAAQLDIWRQGKEIKIAIDIDPGSMM